jgi:hypothetical protein
MSRPHPTAIFGLSAALLAAAAVPVAQTTTPNALAPFGVSEAAVRTMMLDAVAQGGYGSVRVAVWKGYDRMPAAMRPAATSAAFAWAKAYVNSAAFKTAYAKVREEHKPDGATSSGSIDAEVQKLIDQMLQAYEQSKQAVANLPPANRAKELANIDQMIAQVKSPQYASSMRAAMALQRGEETRQNTQSVEDWEAKWPADSQAYVRKHLEHLMAATASVDYGLPQIFVKNPAGQTVGFLSPGLTELPWESAQAILAGKPAVDAARAAVAAWLQELGK